MKTLDDSSIKALISLLEDPNEQVYNEIHQTILALGEDGIVPLQNAFANSADPLQKERIVAILDGLKLNKLEADLNYWNEFNYTDLLDALYKITAYGYPNFDKKEVAETLNKIQATIREQIDINDPKGVIDIMNQVILYDFGFNGNIRNYSGINNSFINKIVENKRSNPIGLSIIYLIMAERLDIPLVGINSPGHFIIGYANDYFSYEDVEDGTIIDNISFFIDPFNNGQKIEVDDYDKWLLEVPYKLEDKKYLPATNKAIVKRVMNNLIYALFTTGEKTTAKRLLDINEALIID
ncbi:MAG: transglutaminase family protein [Flavobacteriaceae bacterium]|uniref:transglutaminase family protein n=1 Tax=Gelidibacter japonicus TaxID=1962232 RepID=UPI001E0857E1|nr:transglutaminase family protein [Flavobacteriaceae bacterium]